MIHWFEYFFKRGHILASQLLKCESFLVYLLLYYSKNNLFGLWTVQNIWEPLIDFSSVLHFIDQAANHLIKKIVDRS